MMKYSAIMSDHSQQGWSTAQKKSSEVGLVIVRTSVKLRALLQYCLMLYAERITKIDLINW
jgi:hypothetical protein